MGGREWRRGSGPPSPGSPVAGNSLPVTGASQIFSSINVTLNGPQTCAGEGTPLRKGEREGCSPPT